MRHKHSSNSSNLVSVLCRWQSMKVELQYRHILIVIRFHMWTWSYHVCSPSRSWKTCIMSPDISYICIYIKQFKEFILVWNSSHLQSSLFGNRGSRRTSKEKKKYNGLLWQLSSSEFYIILSAFTTNIIHMKDMRNT